SVDPKLLCPFCDALLPQPVTPFLRKLINNALKKSRHDPRPGNPLGRKAPSAIFVNVCQRHTFESEELPKAEANSWPKNIDWEQLGDRIRAMRDDLEDLLSDLRAGTSTSLLWEDVKRDLQAKGSRAIASVREQFANFEKAQAGYYGELGYAIIHQSLLDLFPPTSCDVGFANPLTPEQFVQRVLVPEVALRLIQEDMDLRGPTHIAKALQVLRDSSKYGVAMFPDDSND
ncbi:RTC4-like domain containing protein, partial [Amanita muscaria]